MTAENWEGGEDELRGGEGPLSVSPSQLTRRIIDDWIQSAVKCGYKTTEDYNGPDQEGVGYYQMTMRNGRRCSSAVAYLRPAKNRSNLTIITNAHALGIEFDGTRACAVRARVDGKETTIRASREIVLSAGAIGSPQLLMVSGIGPAEHLQQHGVSVVNALPGVGKNLQDHLQARPVYKTTLSTINTEINSLIKQGIIALHYAVTRTGPMTMAASLGTAFLKTREDLDEPDIQFHVQPFSADAKGMMKPHDFNAFTASVLQMRPESAGHLELVSDRMSDYPKIHPNYLATKNTKHT